MKKAADVFNWYKNELLKLYLYNNVIVNKECKISYEMFITTPDNTRYYKSPVYNNGVSYYMCSQITVKNAILCLQLLLKHNIITNDTYTKYNNIMLGLSKDKSRKNTITNEDDILCELYTLSNNELKI